MRIIKLSESEFRLPKELAEFFRDELLTRNPVGKFRITAGRIAADGLDIGEPLLFSYQTMVYYTAEASSARLDNHDESSGDYPYYFLIDMASVRSAYISLYAVEGRLREMGRAKAVVRCQGWPSIPDTSGTNEFWQSLRREMSETVRDVP